MLAADSTRAICCPKPGQIRELCRRNTSGAEGAEIRRADGDAPRASPRDRFGIGPASLHCGSVFSASDLKGDEEWCVRTSR